MAIVGYESLQKVNPVTLRILEAEAYREEFDYDMLESFVDDDIVKANTELMTEIMNRSLEREAEKRGLICARVLGMFFVM